VQKQKILQLIENGHAYTRIFSFNKSSEQDNSLSLSAAYLFAEVNNKLGEITSSSILETTDGRGELVGTVDRSPSTNFRDISPASKRYAQIELGKGERSSKLRR